MTVYMRVKSNLLLPVGVNEYIKKDFLLSTYDISMYERKQEYKLDWRSYTSMKELSYYYADNPLAVAHTYKWYNVSINVYL